MHDRRKRDIRGPNGRTCSPRCANALINPTGRESFAPTCRHVCMHGVLQQRCCAPHISDGENRPADFNVSFNFKFSSVRSGPSTRHSGGKKRGRITSTKCCRQRRTNPSASRTCHVLHSPGPGAHACAGEPQSPGRCGRYEPSADGGGVSSS